MSGDETINKIVSIADLLKILVGQFQYYNEMRAKLHNLPPPKPLPENWDDLIAEPTTPIGPVTTDTEPGDK